MTSRKAFLVIKESSPAQRRRLRGAALDGVRRELRREGFRFASSLRGDFRGAGSASLVVSAGGDGTLLAAARRLRPGQALLGVNTDPGRSVGYLCAAHANNFGVKLRAWLGGKIRPRVVSRLRLQVRRGSRVIREQALNDVLVTSRHPAATSRYILKVQRAGRGAGESQRSSGLWISSAAGSTAAIRGAGGRPLRLESKAFQYRVREPYTSPQEGRPRLLGRVLRPGDAVRVVSRMDGVVYVDGPRVEIPFPRGASLRVDLDPRAILLIR